MLGISLQSALHTSKTRKYTANTFIEISYFALSRSEITDKALPGLYPLEGSLSLYSLNTKAEACCVRVQQAERLLVAALWRLNAEAQWWKTLMVHHGLLYLHDSLALHSIDVARIELEVYGSMDLKDRRTSRAPPGKNDHWS